VSTGGRLLFPAVRWRAGPGFGDEAAAIDEALRIGVGGFCIFRGAAAEVLALTRSLRQRSRFPLLIASDLERGAGQQFTGCTQLPPLAAIGSLDEVATTRAAAALTAREARAVGVNWLFAPAADVDLEPRNPIVGSRAFSGSAPHVARHVAAWIDGAHDAGVLCCAKHFPGHGRTTADSHAALPRICHARADLEQDLLPFRAAIAAGVDSLMTAHVVYDALDATTAATLSRRVLSGLARDELGFRGLIITDALNMAGVQKAVQGGEAAAAVAALDAGCDALLYPDDPAAVARALDEAVRRGGSAARAGDALQRVAAAAQRAPQQAHGSWGAAADREWADGLALRCIGAIRGTPRAAPACTVVTLDDDAGGPHEQPSRVPFIESLRGAGIDVAEAAEPLPGRHAVIAVYSDIRAWKPAPGLSPAARARLEAVLAQAADASVVFFGHRRLAHDVAGENVACAWGGEAVMQRAAARWLAARR
jgi:beta-glucosidase-like glycosyl hydrolase